VNLFLGALIADERELPSRPKKSGKAVEARKRGPSKAKNDAREGTSAGGDRRFLVSGSGGPCRVEGKGGGLVREFRTQRTPRKGTMK